MKNKWIFWGAVNVFLSVACGAFGAHALEGKMSDDMLAIYHTAAQYQMYHGLGLILVGILAELYSQNRRIHLAGWLLLSGIVVFSGSLYLLSFTEIKSLGAITPIGGVAFLTGWFMVAMTAFNKKG